jgi:hypothetical protein
MICSVNWISVRGNSWVRIMRRRVECRTISRCLSRGAVHSAVLDTVALRRIRRHLHPTPTAGRILTSSAASSGSSSRRETSRGPLTEPITVYPRAVYVAEPSGFGRGFMEVVRLVAVILTATLADSILAGDISTHVHLTFLKFVVERV